MRGATAVIQIQCDDADEDGDGDENDGEEQVLSHKWYNKACWRNEVDEHQEEDGQCNENADGKCDLVSFEGDIEDESRKNSCSACITSIKTPNFHIPMNMHGATR